MHISQLIRTSIVIEPLELFVTIPEISAMRYVYGAVVDMLLLFCLECTYHCTYHCSLENNGTANISARSGTFILCKWSGEFIYVTLEL